MGGDVRLISVRQAEPRSADSMKKEYDFSRGKRGPALQSRQNRIEVIIV
jgi:hypothetical protein